MEKINNVLKQKITNLELEIIVVKTSEEKAASEVLALKAQLVRENQVHDELTQQNVELHSSLQVGGRF